MRTLVLVLIQILFAYPLLSATRIFRNAKGIIAVERNGVIIFGSSKALRATDVTIQSFPSENWTALPDSDLRGFDDATITTISGASRLVSIVGGKAAVFGSSSIATETSVRTAINTFVPALSQVELARQRLIAWKAGGTAVTRQVVEDILLLIGAQ